MKKHILSHRIVKFLAKDERETDKRYTYLGKAYKLPKLVKAGRQEGGHAKIFEKLEKGGWRKPISKKHIVTTKGSKEYWEFREKYR